MSAGVECVGGIKTAAQEIVLNLLFDVVRGNVPAFFGELLLLHRADCQAWRSNGELY